jgi:hypothetical protein
MTGLDLLRRHLERPDLTQAQANDLLIRVEAVAGIQEAARLRYLPTEKYLSVAEIADLQGCTVGPVGKRLRVWRERALALLEAEGR